MNTKEDCAGTYPVSGYVKKDGTEVSSYMRTCGAKHEGGINTKLFQTIQNVLTNENIGKMQKIMVNIDNLPYIFCEYYKIALCFTEQKYINKNNSFIKFGGIKDEKLKLFIKEQYSQQKINDSTDVVIVNNGTTLINELINSTEFIQELNNRQAKIYNGEFKNKHFSIDYNDSRNKNLALTFGKINVYNIKQDYLDTLTGVFVDYYDFEWLNKAPTLKKAIYNAINNNAYNQQYNSELQNYIILVPFVLFENVGL